MTQHSARLLILADDLTGALDAAAPFAGRGLVTDVALSPEALGAVLAGPAQVVAVSTQSREITEEEARARVARITRALPPGMRLFKKVDSRLKGHVAAELAALAPKALLVAPAIPDFNRIVTDGAVRGFGVDVPIQIAPLLGPLAALAQIPDTTTPAQMQAALTKATPDTLLVGARGLAEALAIQMTGQAHATPPRPRADHAIFAVGSRDPITMAQVAALRDSGRTAWLGAPNGQLAAQDLPAARLRLVQATAGTSESTGPAVAAALAQSLHPRLTASADLLLLTGGATAEAVLGVMQIPALRLAGDVLPGLPLAHANGLAILAKSGGFGDPQALVRLADILDGVPV